MLHPPGDATDVEPSRSPRRREAERLPLEPAAPRARARRGGPRTPLPVLLAIAVAAGIGVAYVSQTAQATKAVYRFNSLAAAQQQLEAQDEQLGNELARLESSERIVAAAQQLGMRPASRWSYVAAQPVPVIAGAASSREVAASADAVQQVVAALSGSAR